MLMLMTSQCLCPVVIFRYDRKRNKEFFVQSALSKVRKMISLVQYMIMRVTLSQCNGRVYPVYNTERLEHFRTLIDVFQRAFNEYTK
jgi:hypothetical protein